jgi:hypothetical protein
MAFLGIPPFDPSPVRGTVRASVDIGRSSLDTLDTTVAGIIRTFRSKSDNRASSRQAGARVGYLPGGNDVHMKVAIDGDSTVPPRVDESVDQTASTRRFDEKLQQSQQGADGYLVSSNLTMACPITGPTSIYVLVFPSEWALEALP